MKLTNRFIIYFVGLVIGLACMLPQVSIAYNPINQFLLSAQEETSHLVPSQVMLPVHCLATWIDGTEARIGTSNENEINLAFRFRPKFSSERTAEKNLKLLENERRGSAYEAILSDALKNRYCVLIDIFNHKTATEHLIQEVDLSKIRLKLYRSLLQSADIDPERLQEAEFEHFFLEQQIQLYSERLSQIINLNGLPAEMAVPHVHASWLDSIVPISQIIDRVALINDTQCDLESIPRLKSQSLDFRIAQEDFNLAKAQNNSLIKHLDLKYIDKQGRQKDKSEITLGFSIPFGSGHSKLVRRKGDADKAQTIYRQTQLQAVQSLQKNRSDLYWSYRQSESVQQVLKRINHKLSHQQEIKTPLLTLALKQEKIYQQKKLWEYHLQALRDYIDFLHISGQLTSMPLRNRLLKNEPKLKEN